jgi:hypothetical protein
MHKDKVNDKDEQKYKHKDKLKTMVKPKTYIAKENTNSTTK